MCGSAFHAGLQVLKSKLSFYRRDQPCHFETADDLGSKAQPCTAFTPDCYNNKSDLSVSPNSPCKVHQRNKNFIKQLYFFHITNFKGEENSEEKVYDDIRKKIQLQMKGYHGELGLSFTELLHARS